MNVPFDIVKGKGSIIFNPLQTLADVDQAREFIPEESVPYVGEALTTLRKEVNYEAAVLGFVGAPFTLASYVIEGGSSKHFTKVKRLACFGPKGIMLQLFSIFRFGKIFQGLLFQICTLPLSGAWFCTPCFKILPHPWQSTSSTKQTMVHKQFRYSIHKQLNLAQ
ncbi:hypothetical protein Ancab_006054 [Ancistrocladus abbreviatus]